MATKISRLREEYEKRGKAWNGAVYDRAVSKYGPELELDEQRPSETATLGRALAQNAGTTPQVSTNERGVTQWGDLFGPFPIGNPLLGNLSAGAARGMTANIADPDYWRVNTGNKLLDVATNEVAPTLGNILGMTAVLKALPAPMSFQGAGTGLIGMLTRAAARGAPAAQRLSVYEAISGGAEGMREGGIDRAAMGALGGLVRGGAIGGVAGGLPALPAKLGGHFVQGAGLMGGLTAAGGGTPAEIATATLAGGLTSGAMPWEGRAARAAAESDRIPGISAPEIRAPEGYVPETMPLGSMEVGPPIIPASARAETRIPVGPTPVLETTIGGKSKSLHDLLRTSAGVSPENYIPEWGMTGGGKSPEIMAQGGATSRNAPRPPSDIYLGSGLGAANEAVTKAIGSGKITDVRFGGKPIGRGRGPTVSAPRFADAEPIADIGIDRASQGYVRKRDLGEYFRNLSDVDTVRPATVEDIKRIRMTEGDRKNANLDAQTLSPDDAFDAIAGGRPGTPTHEALVAPLGSVERARMAWYEGRKGGLIDTRRSLDIGRGSKTAKIAGQVGEFVGVQDVGADATKLAARPEIAAILARSGLSPAEGIKAVKAAQWGRQQFQEMWQEANYGRSALGREPIQYIQNYVTHMRANGFLERLNEPARLGDGTPDFIHKIEVFNPRAEHRSLLDQYTRNTDIFDLVDQYAKITSRDIFHSAAMRHYNAVAKQFRAAGMPNAASAIQQINDRIYGGKTPFFTEMAQKAGLTTGAPGEVRRAAHWLSRTWFGNIFKFNPVFPITTQLAGTAIIPGYVGSRATAKGARYMADRQFWSAAKKNVNFLALKYGTEGKLTEAEGLTSARSERSWYDRLGNAAVNAMEEFTTMAGAAAGYARGGELGLTGRARWDYAGEVAVKVSGYYDAYLKPGILSGSDISLVDPMQSFNARMAANLGSQAGARVGLYNAGIKSGAPQAARVATRVWRIGRIMGYLLAANYLTEKTTGRKGWQMPGSFLPFGNMLTGGIQDVESWRSGERTMEKGRPWVGQVVTDFADAVYAAAFKEEADWKPLRRFFLTYVKPGGGGVQMERMIKAAEAFADGGRVEGRPSYTVPEDQMFEAYVFGPSGTRAAQEARKKQKERADARKKQKERADARKKGKSESRQSGGQYRGTAYRDTGRGGR